MPVSKTKVTIRAGIKLARLKRSPTQIYSMVCVEFSNNDFLKILL